MKRGFSAAFVTSTVAAATYLVWFLLRTEEPIPDQSTIGYALGVLFFLPWLFFYSIALMTIPVLRKITGSLSGGVALTLYLLSGFAISATLGYLLVSFHGSTDGETFELSTDPRAQEVLAMFIVVGCLSALTAWKLR